MKFVTAPTRKAVFQAAKGVYRNRFGRNTHHPRKSQTPINFVGVDGEGVTDNQGVHRYVLFGVGSQQISNTQGLRYPEIFRFLYDQYKPGTAYVGFFLGYDYTQILKTFPEHAAWMALTTEGQKLRKHRIPGKSPHPVLLPGWQFDLLANKRMRIRPKDCDCEVATCGCKFRPWMYVCDAGSFFQTSFLKVIDPKGWSEGTAVVTPDEYALIQTGKERRATAVLDDDMLMYNRLENEILARVMHTVDAGLHEIGVHLAPSKWFGPGQAAQAWLKTTKAPTRQDLENIPRTFMEAARSTYFGGWFEIMMHGIIPGDSHEYDINSAYPSIIADLPCLQHGTYSRGDGDRPPSEGITFVYAKVRSVEMPYKSRAPIGAMLHRDRHGRILRPYATEGWFVKTELDWAELAGLIRRPEIQRWVHYQPCDCPPPMADIAGLYEKRLQYGKTSPMGKGAKTVYNSGYGKFAQSEGEPVFGNPIYATLITSGCRSLILQAIATHPGGLRQVAMVATDAVYFLTEHPHLPISEKLGEWDHQIRRNLTLFKPGVYWDDRTRESIALGYPPSFKARGFSARDFAASITTVDAQFSSWKPGHTPWPIVTFPTNFSMITALQALRRGRWDLAGTISSEMMVVQDSNPGDKRTGLKMAQVDGRMVWRSKPHAGMVEVSDGTHITLETIKSEPYQKRFGMEDPFSDEYQQQYGITQDGSIHDIFRWLLKGE